MKKVNPTQLKRLSGREKGYVLLVLLVSVALLAVAAAAVAPIIAFELRRDREEELIHRGVQYSRAIRRYFKKFGRYPTRIEELEKSNNMRFLRRRYKDPITGEDFKLLHYGEVKTNSRGGVAGASPMGMNPGGLNARGGMNTRPGGIGLVGSPSGSPFATPQQTAAPQTNEGQSPDQEAGSSSPAPASAAQSNQSSSASSGSSSSKQVFGGGPIVGVVSTSPEATIRVFDKDKKHYNDWQFIYDPSMDQGGLLTTPGQQMRGSGGQPAQQAPGNRGLQPGQGPGQPQAPAPPQGNQDNDND